MDSPSINEIIFKKMFYHFTFCLCLILKVVLKKCQLKGKGGVGGNTPFTVYSSCVSSKLCKCSYVVHPVENVGVQEVSLSIVQPVK